MAGDGAATDDLSASDDPTHGADDPETLGRRGRSTAERPVAKPDTIQLMNIRGLANNSEPRIVRRGKIDFLKDLSSDKNSLFVALTETWLNQDHNDAEVCPEGYDILRQDREGRECGGIALLVRDDLTAEPVVGFSNDGCEFLAVKILELNHICYVIYRPPGTPYAKFREMRDKLEESLAGLSSPCPDVTVMGDLNYNSRDMVWIEEDSGDLRAEVKPWRDLDSQEHFQERRQASEFVHLMQYHNFVQVVNIPTREEEVLDLIFTNDPDLIHTVESESYHRVSDHNLVTATVNYYYKQTQHNTGLGSKPQDEVLTPSERFQQLNFHEADWNKINRELTEEIRVNNDWNILTQLEPDIGVVWFYEQMLEIFERNVPRKKLAKSGTKKNIRYHRRAAWKLLKKLQKKIKTAGSATKVAALLLEMRHIQSSLLEQTEERDRDAEKKATEQIRTNSKAFYSFTRSRQRAKVKVGPFKDKSGSINPDPANTVDALKTQYESVFSTPKADKVVLDPESFFSDSPAEHPHLTDVNFTREDLEEACKEISPVSAAGPDGLPAKLLRECSATISQPLFLIWRNSLDKGVIPQDLLLLLICPVHKGGLR